MQHPPRRGRRGKAPRRTPTVGLAIIARNEEAALPGLLNQVKGVFDQVALVDDDSTDRTVELFREWCAHHRQEHVIDNRSWTHDFGAQRNHAFSLLTTDWLCWTDPHETIHGIHNLRRIVAGATNEDFAFEFEWDYFHDEHGQCIHTVSRERLVRRGLGIWDGRVHEMLMTPGTPVQVARDIAYWSHHPKTATELARAWQRDTGIFEKWAAEEPDNPWVRMRTAEWGPLHDAMREATAAMLPNG